MAFNRSAIKWKSLYVTQNGKLVAVSLDKLTDAQIKAALGMAANANALADNWKRLSNGQIAYSGIGTVAPGTAAPIAPGAKAPTASTPSPAAPTPAAPESPAPTPAAPAPTPAAPAVIDPRDAEYWNQYNAKLYDKNVSLAAQQAELDKLPSLYNRGSADIGTAYNRDRYDSNAELARRGIVRSGEYQRRGADRIMTQGRQLSDLEQQYGSGARSTIASRIADINNRFNLETPTLLTDARNRYASQYPASSYIWANTGS
jgi:hypothetical protein